MKFSLTTLFYFHRVKLVFQHRFPHNIFISIASVTQLLLLDIQAYFSLSNVVYVYRSYDRFRRSDYFDLKNTLAIMKLNLKSSIITTSFSIDGKFYRLRERV